MKTPLTSACTPLLSITLALWTAACSSTSADKKIDQEVQTAPATPQAQREQEVEEMIRTSHLSDPQKLELASLNEGYKKKAHELHEEYLKLRQVLIDTIAKSDFSFGELDAVEKKIRANYKARADLLFKTIGQANKVLGRLSPKEQAALRRNVFVHDRGL